MNTSKIKSLLPGSEISEIRPCTAPGKLQFHLMVGGRGDLMTRIVDISMLAILLEEHPLFSDVKASQELGVVRARYKDVELSILASGRAVVKKVSDRKEAQDILEALAPLIKKALF